MRDNAVEAMLAGKPVPVEVTRPMGCSTKWIGHNEVQQLQQQWTTAPVTLETIDAAGVAALVKNPTSKLRLINVWATWCGPCVAEFPGLVSISQRLSNRDFELITISLDDPKDQAKAKAFLEKQHAAVSNRLQRSLKAEGRTTNNYLFTSADADALMQALDRSAPGPIPYTLIVAPGGKILYRHAGEVDVADTPGSLTCSARITHYRPLTTVASNLRPSLRRDGGDCSIVITGPSSRSLRWHGCSIVWISRFSISSRNGAVEDLLARPTRWSTPRTRHPFFLIGWAVGGLILRRAGRRFGRARVLTVSILIYSVCTGLSSFAGSFRGFCAFSFSQVWASAECSDFRSRWWRIPCPMHRAPALGLFKSLSTVGNILAGLTGMGIGLAAQMLCRFI